MRTGGVAVTAPAKMGNGALGVICPVRAQGVERVEHDVVVVSIDRLTQVLRAVAEMQRAARSSV